MPPISRIHPKCRYFPRVHRASGIGPFTVVVDCIEDLFDVDSIAVLSVPGAGNSSRLVVIELFPIVAIIVPV
jgi:hypothetical protein